MKPITASIPGIITAIYGALWGSITWFGIGIALAVAASVAVDCWRDVREVGK